MATYVEKSKFKSKAIEYFRQVESSGERLVVTEDGKPTLEIRSLKPEHDPLQQLRGTVLRHDRPFDPATDDDWEAIR